MYKSKFSLNQYVEFEMDGKTVSGKIIEITLFRRCESLGLGIAGVSKGGRIVYIGEEQASEISETIDEQPKRYIKRRKRKRYRPYNPKA